jgi:RNA polymerase-binding transcription factor DksA
MKKKKQETTPPPQFPMTVLKPVQDFLNDQLKQLQLNKKKLSKEDPFKNKARVDDNAAADTEAEEQFGHARVSAIKEQIDRRMIETRKALTRIKIGKYGICINCGKMIDTDRLMVYPEAVRCINCERKK